MFRKRGRSRATCSAASVSALPSTQHGASLECVSEPWVAVSRSSNFRTHRPGRAIAISVLAHSDVEVHHVFAGPKLRVEVDGGIVAVIGLDEDHIGTAPSGDAAQLLDQRGRDAL